MHRLWVFLDKMAGWLLFACILSGPPFMWWAPLSPAWLNALIPFLAMAFFGYYMCLLRARTRLDFEASKEFVVDYPEMDQNMERPPELLIVESADLL